ncbi:helix-turn-helix domain-containing protein [Clostridium chromiireducens]|uniref:helix-turn-helix domain-containing protein n=1 Tax=Clostridium chromiireducens TaxID=225345 RepID=UPI003AF86B3B
MVQQYRNIYQIARKCTGFTQEKASELMNISVDSLRAYEGDKRVPLDNIVIKMIEIYYAQYLAYQHMKTKTQIGEEFLPELQFKFLAEAVLAFLDEYEDLEKIKKLMIRISRDGQIDDNEKDDWEKVMKEINDVIAAGMVLSFTK